MERDTKKVDTVAKWTKLYELVLIKYNRNSESVISKSFYTNAKAGKKSFETLKERVLKNNNWTKSDIVDWSDLDCELETISIAEEYNLSLVKWDMSNKESKWV